MVSSDSFLKDGIPIASMDDPAASETHYQKQAGLLGWMLTPAAQAATKHLMQNGARKNISVLDVGAGSGIWSLSLAAADSQTRLPRWTGPVCWRLRTRQLTRWGYQTG